VKILGAEQRAPPLVRLSPAVSSLLARIAKHVGLLDDKNKTNFAVGAIERT
jgi:hypothetical protein